MINDQIDIETSRQATSSWWLNQPLRKRWSNWIMSPRFRVKNPKCLSCHHLARWPHRGHQQPKKKNFHITRSEPSSEGTAVIEADEFLDGILGRFLKKKKRWRSLIFKKKGQLGSSSHNTTLHVYIWNSIYGPSFFFIGAFQDLHLDESVKQNEPRKKKKPRTLSIVLVCLKGVLMA